MVPGTYARAPNGVVYAVREVEDPSRPLPVWDPRVIARPPTATIVLDQTPPKERPKWLIPVAIGGGILVLGGIGYIIYRTRRQK